MSTTVPKPVDVEAFLKEHPGFLNEHPELLLPLQLPHDLPDGVESLLERQIDLLRKRSAMTEEQLRDLLAAARENERIHRQMHDLAVVLMLAEDLDMVFDGVESSLYEDFKVDRVALRIIPPEWVTVRNRPEFASPASVEPYLKMLGDRQAKVGIEMDAVQRGQLWGRSKIGSAALIALRRTGAPFGIIALGSEDKERFGTSTGTVYLQQLGEMVSAVLGRCLKIHA